MSAFGGRGKADIAGWLFDVRLWHKADVRVAAGVLLLFGLDTRLACQRRPFWNLGGNIGCKLG